LLFSNYKGKIVGVVEDYHTQDLRYPIAPTIFLPAKNAAFDATNYLLIRTEGEDQSELLAQMKTTWKELIPGIPFEYEWVETTLGNQYREEAKTGLLLGGFAFLTLLISGLGLYGLSLFATESRRKEIGIRRVLGASVSAIVGRFSGEFLILVGIALCIALPIGYFLMEEWLDQFAKKVSISVWFFMLSALLTSLVAYLTVSLQSYRAALQNPVESIKSE
jgi:putative ABC transport system permease protein